MNKGIGDRKRLSLGMLKEVYLRERSASKQDLKGFSVIRNRR